MRVYYDRDADVNLIKGKKVVIIGSGATAMTLLPAMTDKAAHVIIRAREYDRPV